VGLEGIRATLFSTALFSAVMFANEGRTAWGIICAFLTGRVRERQLIGFASLGWFVAGLSTMLLTFHRMLNTLTGHRNTHAIGTTWDGLWLSVGEYGLAWGFYIPVLAILWYRRRIKLGIGLGFAAIAVGLLFAFLEYRLQTKLVP